MSWLERNRRGEQGSSGDEREQLHDVRTAHRNLARLCGEAQPGQILVPRRLYGVVDDFVTAEPVGELSLKGFSRPVTAYNVTGLKPA